MATIVVVGSYGVGLTVRLDRAPVAGETVVGTAFDAAHGGKGSNQAVAAARLGARVRLCTVVGDDPYGERARELWASEGVECTLVRSARGTTMVGVILVEATGENRIAIVPGVLALFGQEQLTGLEDVLADVDLLVAGLEIPVDTAQLALLAARRAGVPTLLNPAPAPPRPLTAELLDAVDHLTPNQSEASILTGLPLDADPYDLVGHQVFDPVSTVALTMGAAGVLVRSAGRVEHIPSPDVSAVDTTGAGDAFNGAYAVAVAGGDDPFTAARFAVRAAAHSVQHEHVIPSLPTLEVLAPIGEESTR